MSLLQRYFSLGVNHPLPSLIFVLLASLGAAFGLPKLTVDTGFERLIPRDDMDRQAYLRVSREFGSDHRSFIYVRDPQLWTPEKLAALERLHHDLRALPFVERLDDLFTHRTTRSIGGRLQAQPLLVEAPASAQAAQQARAEALQDPVAVRNLVSAGGNAVAIAVSIRETDGKSSDSVVHEALERVLEPARKQFEELMQVGAPRINAEIRQSLVRDLRLLLPASALLLV